MSQVPTPDQPQVNITSQSHHIEHTEAGMTEVTTDRCTRVGWGQKSLLR